MANSYNGWRASTDRAAIGVAPLVVASVSFPGGVKTGPVAVVLGHVAAQFHARVEPLVAGWCWGYNYRQNRNANNLSTHSSGTSIDINAPRHPNGKRGTFTAAQVSAIRRILSEVGGTVRWGGDFTGTPDEMHFEIVADSARVAAVAARLSAGNTLTQSQSQSDQSEGLNLMTAEFNQLHANDNANAERINKLAASVDAIYKQLHANDNANADRLNKLAASLDSIYKQLHADANANAERIDKLAAKVDAK